MKIIPHGAAQEVTGTCHEIQIESATGTKRILLDCGLFQGKRQEAAVKNAEFTFNPTEIDAVVLTHAHADHCGRMPLLYKKGYRGPVYCTYATKDLAEVMLQDSGYIHEKDEEYFCRHLAKSMMECEGPLYTQQDAIDCIEIFQGHNYNDWFDVCDGIKAQFLDAGHIVGAAMIVLEIVENGKVHRVGFSGDLGRNTLPIIRDPAPMPPVDTLICESTYGNRKHEEITTAKHTLQDVIIRTAKRGGKVFIPAFSLERTQEIVYDLHVLWDAKGIPALPIFIDSPLASRVTEVFMKHPECYDKEMYEIFLSRGRNPFQFSLVKYTESVEESKALNENPGPLLIMAGSGMCEAGRIRHHLRNGIENERNTVLAVGYMAENTLGRRIVDPKVAEVKIFDQFYRKQAEVVSINAYSGHADMADLDRFIYEIERLKTVILVHGEMDEMEPFSKRITQVRSNVTVLRPSRGEVIEITI
ncbi:MAG: MBL fold metallo-hydrolase [Candidatus Peribacteraceae bacterium]|nr:MBL fold metallo-hydrolase [Candidatus Peribacteraceae bacterium]